jgi:hypothetical protein
MPDATPAPSASPAQSSPGAAGATQPPMGSSPATQPTPNRGFEMAAQQALGVVVMALEQALPKAGTSSPMGQDILKALQILSKHVPPGSVNPAAQNNQIQKMAQGAAQNAQQQAMLRQQQAAPPGAAAPPKAA